MVITWPFRDLHHAVRAHSAQGPFQPHHARVRQCIAPSAIGYSGQAGGRDIIDPNKSIDLPDSGAAPGAAPGAASLQKGVHAQRTAGGESNNAQLPRNPTPGRRGRRVLRTIKREPGARERRQYDPERHQQHRPAGSTMSREGISSNGRQLRAVGPGWGRGRQQQQPRSRDGNGRGRKQEGLWDSQVDEASAFHEQQFQDQRLQEGDTLRPQAYRSNNAVRRPEMRVFDSRGRKDGASQPIQRPTQRPSQHPSQGPSHRPRESRGWEGGSGHQPQDEDVWGAGQAEMRRNDRNSWQGKNNDRRQDRQQGRNAKPRLRGDGRGRGGGRGRGRGTQGVRNGEASDRRGLSAEQLSWQSALNSYKLEGLTARQDEAYQRMVSSLHKDSPSDADILSTSFNRNASQTRMSANFSTFEPVDSSEPAYSGDFDMQFSSFPGASGAGSSWLDLDDDMGMYEADFARFMPEEGSSSSWWTGADGAGSIVSGTSPAGSASMHDTSDSWWLPEDGAANADDTDGELDALLNLLGGVDVVEKPSTARGSTHAQNGASALQEGDSDQRQFSLSDSAPSEQQEPLSFALHTIHTSTQEVLAGSVAEEAPRWAQAWDSSQALQPPVSSRDAEGRQDIESSFKLPPPVVPQYVPSAGKPSSGASFDDGDMLMDLLKDVPN